MALLLKNPSKLSAQFSTRCIGWNWTSKMILWWHIPSLCLCRYCPARICVSSDFFYVFLLFSLFFPVSSSLLFVKYSVFYLAQTLPNSYMCVVYFFSFVGICFLFVSVSSSAFFKSIKQSQASGLAPRCVSVGIVQLVYAFHLFVFFLFLFVFSPVFRLFFWLNTGSSNYFF